MGGACYVGAGSQTQIPRRVIPLYMNSAAAQSGQPAARPYVWRNVEIVAGGFVSGIVFNLAQSDLLYARTDIGGAYRWNPSSKRWIPLTDHDRQNQGRHRRVPLGRWGAAWTRINDDQHQWGWIGQVVIGDPRVYGRVYVGTNGRGILYGEPAGLSQSAQK